YCFVSNSVVFVVGFFFFQAEDGIRDFHVTGVQTCALPISSVSAPGRGWSVMLESVTTAIAWLIRALVVTVLPVVAVVALAVAVEIGRASCRKECRARWWPHRKKKKRNSRHT